MASHSATWIHLPESRDEIEGMKRIYRSAFEGKIGLAATEMGVKDAFSTARIVHVAAHGFVDREIAFLSRIRLASDSSSNDDGPFHTFEFVGIVPPTPVLILSGCNTLSVSGVSNSFRDGADIRTAPAQVTIGSLWNVDDHMASLLMQKFHKHLATGVTPAEALSLAKNELISEGRIRSLRLGCVCCCRSATLECAGRARSYRKLQPRVWLGCCNLHAPSHVGSDCDGTLPLSRQIQKERGGSDFAATWKKARARMKGGV